MKFWELYSICRENHGFLELALKNAECPTYWQWYQGINNIIITQQRDKLDAEMPHKIVCKALEGYPGKVFQSGEIVRSYRFSENDEEISYLDVYQKYGGSFLEEVLEKGSKKI